MFLCSDPPVEVFDKVFIGSINSAAKHKCDAVISMIDRTPTYEDNWTPPETLCFHMNDGNITPANISHYMSQFNSALIALKNFRKQKRSVLVHCLAGINRSATLIALYMIDCGFTPENAFSKLAEANKKRDTIALTNTDFRKLVVARHMALSNRRHQLTSPCPQ